MFRIGQGFDVHAIKEGNHIILGGVRIPADFSLKGYSDADVLLHAITDALLGSIAAADIGFYFPPDKPENKNRASKDFLLFAHQLIKEKKYQISNLDATVICEVPKINPHRQAIQKNIAELLEISPDKISIKATTTETLGFTGRQEGIATQCVVLVYKE